MMRVNRTIELADVTGVVLVTAVRREQGLEATRTVAILLAKGESQTFGVR